jgi:hypothetical protein
VSGVGPVAVKVVLGVLNALGLFLAFSVWWLRLSGRLTGEPDAPEIILLTALFAAAPAVLALLVGAVAVRVRWVDARWLAIPVAVILAAVVGVCTVAGDL